MEEKFVFETPVGRLKAVLSGDALSWLHWTDEEPSSGEGLSEAAKRVRTEIGEYLAGQRRELTVPFEVEGTEFQRLVWCALREIPYGETRTYGEIAERIGRPRAVRAVGAACGKNGVVILVPCHRVVGADGSLTGYNGGVEIKRALLALEKEKKD